LSKSKKAARPRKRQAVKPGPPQGTGSIAPAKAQDQQEASSKRTFTGSGLAYYLFGGGMSTNARVLLLVLLSFQVLINFQVFYNKPVPSQYFPAYQNYQDVDVTDWIYTGAMLPGNAPQVRAMRPLYPFPITIAKWLGIVKVRPDIASYPPGKYLKSPVYSLTAPLYILLGFNCLMAVAALYIFCAICLRFGFSLTSAIGATLIAGGGFGFTFWVSQAVPEVFGYFVMAASLGAIIIAFENEGSGQAEETRAQQLKYASVAWGAAGLLVGILLLGKELYCVPVFAGLLLLFTRRFAGLAAFSIAVILPTLVWNFYMAKIVGAYDPRKYLNDYRFVIWLFQDLPPASWPQRIAILWHNLWLQIVSFGQAYAFVPVALAAVGLATHHRAIPRQGWVLAAFFAGLYVMFLASNFIRPRLMFISWPVVYYFGWLGLEWLAEKITSGIRSGDSRAMLQKYLKIATVLGLIYLGTRQQFAWYYYG